ncbi:alpha/beta hydrolase [Methylobacterium sp. Gmos1]
MRAVTKIILAGTMLIAPAVSHSADGHSTDPSRYFVPSTVSPPARTALSRAYAEREKQPEIKEPTDLAGYDALNARVAASRAAQNQRMVDALGVRVTEAQLGGVPVLRIAPKTLRSGSGPVVYIHGGGYVLGSARSTVGAAAWIADATGREVVSVDYTLAPRADYRVVTDQVVAVWKALLAAGGAAGSMAIAGDSAGGNMTIASTLKLRDQGIAMPGALWVLSPNTDLTRSGDTYTTLKNADPILPADQLPWFMKTYVGNGDIDSPYASPIKGDFAKPFPPTLIQGGTHEILLSDFVRLYQAIRSGGGDAVLDLYEGMPHVFQVVVPEVPETRIAGSRAAAFLDKSLEPAARKDR